MIAHASATHSMKTANGLSKKDNHNTNLGGASPLVRVQPGSLLKQNSPLMRTKLTKRREGNIRNMVKLRVLVSRTSHNRPPQGAFLLEVKWLTNIMSL